jgi:hypothetical protein
LPYFLNHLCPYAFIHLHQESMSDCLEPYLVYKFPFWVACWPRITFEPGF